jgi:hypothetical protein
MGPRGFLAIAVFMAVFLPAAARAQSSAPGDEDLYLRGLELIVQGSITDAMVLMRELVDTYPQSRYAARASALLAKYGNQRDRGGIVLFYITNLLTTVSFAEALPSFLGSNDSLVLGLSGLAGVGIGVGGSYLLSRDRDLSFGQELWLDTAQILGTINYTLVFDLLAPPGDPGWSRFNGLGAALVATAARAGVFALVGESALPSGKPAFILLNYLLGYLYTVAFLDGVLKSTDRVLNDVSTFAFPTAVAAASYFIWDTARWPDYRTGLTVLGALGGALTGVFTDLVVSRLVPSIDSRNLFVIPIVTAIGGQVVTALLTDRIPPEEKRLVPLSFRPAVDASGAIGVEIRWSY